MKIVVLDGYTLNPGDLNWDGLKEMGELIVHQRTSYDSDIIIKTIGNCWSKRKFDTWIHFF